MSEGRAVERYRGGFPSLEFEWPAEGVLRIVMSAPGRLNAADAAMHRDLAAVWGAVDADPEVRVVIVRGAGDAFSAGGDLDLVEAMADDFATRAMSCSWSWASSSTRSSFFHAADANSHPRQPQGRLGV